MNRVRDRKEKRWNYLRKMGKEYLLATIICILVLVALIVPGFIIAFFCTILFMTAVLVHCRTTWGGILYFSAMWDLDPCHGA